MKMEAAFNRSMRKTARTVVWESAGAQSPAPDPIANDSRMRLFVQQFSLWLFCCQGGVLRDS